MADPKRQQQGRINKLHGQKFEARLDAAFEYYKALGVASVDKTPEPMKVTRPLGKGKFEAFFVKKAQPDYEGTLRGGRTIMLEAKHTDRDRLEYDRVKKEQRDYLDDRERLGARCYVLAGFSTGNVYRIPWAAWRGMKEIFGRKYVTEADLTKYKVQTAPDGTPLVLDKHERSTNHE